MKKERITYYSECTLRESAAVVLLPDNYSDNYSTERKYPTLYALHGYWGDESSLSADGAIEEVISRLYPGCITVFPYIYVSRAQERCTALDLFNSVAYDSFIFELTCCLIPEIERRYSIDESRESRYICGFSMGGRESLYIGLTRPDLFSVVGAACPAPGLTPGEDRTFHPGQLREEFLRPCCDRAHYPKILITAAENDTVVGKIPYFYSSLLTKNGVPNELHEVPAGGHDNNTVKAHLERLAGIIG